MTFLRSIHLLAFASTAIVPHSVLAHEADETTQEPGFRPYSEHAAAFVDGLDQATIAVHPTLLRGVVDNSYSMASQKQTIEWLRQKQNAVAVGYFQMAIESDPDNDKLRRDYEDARQQLKQAKP